MRIFLRIANTFILHIQINNTFQLVYFSLHKTDKEEGITFEKAEAKYHTLLSRLYEQVAHIGIFKEIILQNNQKGKLIIRIFSL